jgi:hypothetical protein
MTGVAGRIVVDTVDADIMIGDSLTVNKSLNFPDNSIVDSMIDTTGIVVSNAGHATLADSAAAITDGGIDSLDFNQTQTDAYVNLLIGPFIDTTTLDTIQNAHKAVLADSAIAIQDSVVGTSFTSTGAASGTITLYGATSGSASITVADVAGTPAPLVVPTTDGSSGNLLSTNGAGILSWAAASGFTLNDWYGVMHPRYMDTTTALATDSGIVKYSDSAGYAYDVDSSGTEIAAALADRLNDIYLTLGDATDTTTLTPTPASGNTVLGLNADVTLRGNSMIGIDSASIAKYEDGSIDSPDLANDAVTAAKLANSAVDSGAILQTSKFYMPLWSGLKIFGSLTTGEGGVSANDTLTSFDGTSGVKIVSNTLASDSSNGEVATALGARADTAMLHDSIADVRAERDSTHAITIRGHFSRSIAFADILNDSLGFWHIGRADSLWAPLGIEITGVYMGLDADRADTVIFFESTTPNPADTVATPQIDTLITGAADNEMRATNMGRTTIEAGNHILVDLRKIYAGRDELIVEVYYYIKE